MKLRTIVITSAIAAGAFFAYMHYWGKKLGTS